eukprot:scaffold44972_cov38-Prasinocladus_malaysianus.AAC.1
MNAKGDLYSRSIYSVIKCVRSSGVLIQVEKLLASPPTPFQSSSLIELLWADPCRFCLVMERADKSLQDALTHEHLAKHDSASVAKVASDLARSVAHVHEKQLVHCDIKVMYLLHCTEF